MARPKPLQRRHELIKNAGVIHARNRWSLVENKLFNLFLKTAYPTLQTNRKYKLSTQDICEHLGWTGTNNTQLLKDALIKLTETSIQYNIFDDGKEAWCVCPIMGSTLLEDGVCTFRFNEDIRSHLALPEVYARLKIRLMRLLTTRTSLILYENCYRFKDIGKTPWLDIDTEFKSIFGLSPDQYQDRRNWMKQLVRRPVKEINDVTDIKITPNFRKESRRFKWIQFTIEKNPKTKAGLELMGQTHIEDVIIAAEDNQAMEDLCVALEAWNINTETSHVKKILEAFPVDELTRRFQYATKHIRDQNTISTGGGTRRLKKKPTVMNEAGLILKIMQNGAP